MIATRYILVGERHGIKNHPLALTCILSALKNEQSDLFLEHINTDQQRTVDEYRKMHPLHAGGLGKALKWWETGWPEWGIYAPIFEHSWRLNISLYGADLPNNTRFITEEVLVDTIGKQAPTIIADLSLIHI